MKDIEKTLQDLFDEKADAWYLTHFLFFIAGLIDEPKLTELLSDSTDEFESVQQTADDIDKNIDVTDPTTSIENVEEIGEGAFKHVLRIMSPLCLDFIV